MANRWGNSGNSGRIFLGGFQNICYFDCSHEIKRCLLLGRKVVTNLDSIFKSRDITLPTKVRIIKAMVFPVVIYGCESWTVRRAERWRMMLLNCGVGEDSWESLGLQGDPRNPSQRRSFLSIHWKDWCWSGNSNTSDTWCKELTHLTRPRCWERLKAVGEVEMKWLMPSLTQWTWVWVNSGSWWCTGRPGVVQSVGLQRVGHDWATELNWDDGMVMASLVAQMVKYLPAMRET